MSGRSSAAAVLVVALFGLVPAQALTPGLPDGFTDELIATVSAPTAVAFTPEGGMLIAAQSGRVYLHDPASEAALGAPVLDLSAGTCSNLERGLLGLAVDPAHRDNHFVYAFYTADRDGECVHRVSRFELVDRVINPGSEKILIDGIPSQNANHNGGDLQFGPDGHLYASVGDGGCDYDGGGCAGGNDASRDEHVLVGKILRITTSGEAPDSNPFVGDDADPCAGTGRTEPGRRCTETFAWGLRNPFRFAFDPNAEGGRFYINDVGQDDWEEIDEGMAGADYGWNVREGECVRNEDDCGDPVDGFVNPIYAYPHNGCGAITGGAFVPRDVWPDQYDGVYLFSDYNCGTIFVLEEDDKGRFDREEFASGLGSGSAVHMVFGPWNDSQALYYTTFEGGGEVRRLSYTGSANRPPTGFIEAEPVAGETPLRVTFDGSASSDPDDESVVYEWDFGDGTEVVETDEPTVRHTYEVDGVHRARLVVVDSEGARSRPVELSVGAGRSAPEASVDVPPDLEPFAVGDPVNLGAQVRDAEDGDLDGAALSWTVLLHHEDHTHPFLGPVEGSSVSFDAPPPESLGAAETSYLEVRLTATDSEGLTTMVVRNLQPRLVEVTLASDPAGLDLVINGTTMSTPVTVSSWEGLALDLEARDQGRGPDRHIFKSWSDGGALRHTVITPGQPETFTARFIPSPD
ncbi:MAG: PQQ-dependent sugar dehydrogenase [Acidimicrobiia bacterium]